MFQAVWNFDGFWTNTSKYNWTYWKHWKQWKHRKQRKWWKTSCSDIAQRKYLLCRKQITIPCPIQRRKCWNFARGPQHFHHLDGPQAWKRFFLFSIFVIVYQSSTLIIHKLKFCIFICLDYPGIIKVDDLCCIWITKRPEPYDQTKWFQIFPIILFDASNVRKTTI